MLRASIIACETEALKELLQPGAKETPPRLSLKPLAAGAPSRWHGSRAEETARSKAQRKRRAGVLWGRSPPGWEELGNGSERAWGRQVSRGDPRLDPLGGPGRM